MDAVIVAAGEGTRMRPLSTTRPKPLLPVGRRTLLERAMAQCAPHVDRFVIVVGYRRDQLRDRIGDEFEDTPVAYVTQDEQLGTAHAIGRAADVVDDRFLALNGDLVVDDDLVDRLAAAEGHAVGVTTVDHPSNYGVVDVADGDVTGIVEKPADPPSNLVNVGVYAFDPSVFDAIDRTEESPRGEYELTDSIEYLLDDGESVAAVEFEGTWLDVGRPWELLDANEAVLAELEARPDGGERSPTASGANASGIGSGDEPTPSPPSDGDDAATDTVTAIDGTVESGADLHGPVVVEEGARVRSGAYVEGPVVICEGADVGPNAYVRGATVIGEGARVGNAVEVKNSVLLPGATVGHLSYVGDSILGADVNFGAGTVVANLRHDEANVRMRVKGEGVDTGRRKLGVVLGDDAKTGIDTSLNAGVVLGVDAHTTPGETVTRDRGRDFE